MRHPTPAATEPQPCRLGCPVDGRLVRRPCPVARSYAEPSQHCHLACATTANTPAPDSRRWRCRRRDSNPRHADYDGTQTLAFAGGLGDLGPAGSGSAGSDLPGRGHGWGHGSRGDLPPCLYGGARSRAVITRKGHSRRTAQLWSAPDELCLRNPISNGPNPFGRSKRVPSLQRPQEPRALASS